MVVLEERAIECLKVVARRVEGATLEKSTTATPAMTIPDINAFDSSARDNILGDRTEEGCEQV